MISRNIHTVGETQTIVQTQTSIVKLEMAVICRAFLLNCDDLKNLAKKLRIFTINMNIGKTTDRPDILEIWVKNSSYEPLFICK